VRAPWQNGGNTNQQNIVKQGKSPRKKTREVVSHGKIVFRGTGGGTTQGPSGQEGRGFNQQLAQWLVERNHRAEEATRAIRIHYEK